MSELNLATMSDDEIMNMSEPPAAAEAPGSEAQVEEVQTTEEEPAAQSGETEVETPEAGAEAAAEVGEADPATVDAAAESAPAEGADPAKTPEAAAKDPAEKPTPVAAEAQPVDYEGFYKQIMTPFKANGKTIELKDPKEAIQLMQMGANYTRKLQDIAPHRKMLLMLQNNDLLDEGKLSYLIDLDKKNPEAIKKLIKDAGIDPMDIDTSSEPAYHEGNHRVSDAEANFRQTLDELTSSESGQETIRIINTDWDQASKEVLWESPQIMAVIDEQRSNGVYEAITTEIDRQRTLGQISPNTPFLEAYKTVGDQIYGGQQPAQADTPKTGPAPVATTAAAPKSPVANDDKANAASPTRTTPRKAEKLVNPLAMSDDEFLSSMASRL